MRPDSAASPPRGVVPSALVAVVVLSAFVAGKAVRDAIILATFDVARLPLFLGISAALSLPFVLVMGRFMTRYGPRRIVPGLNAASAGLLVVEALLYQTSPRTAAIVCFVHLSVIGGVLVSGFWSAINERFDARVAKRQVARIGFGATVGAVVGGVIAERVSVYAPIEALMVVVAALQMIAAAAVWRSAPTAVEPRDPTDVADARTVVSVLRGNVLLRQLGALLVLCAIGAAILDFVFKAHLATTQDTTTLVRTLAAYHAGVNVATALVQLLFARFVIARAGVAHALSTLPAVTLTATAIAALVPGTWSITGARASEMAIRSSIFRAAYELVYAPLPAHEKRAAKVALDVGAERIGDLLGAQAIAVLLWLEPVSPRVFLACAIAIGVLSLVVSMRIPRSYAASLEATLLERTELTPERRISTLAETGDLTMLSLLDLREPYRSAAPPATAASEPVVETTLADPVAIAVGHLRSGDPTRVRSALAASASAELVPFIVPLLAWDAVAAEAARVLRSLAATSTGVLADVLLDPAQEFTIRRRIPAILVHGTPKLAAYALSHSVVDARFEIRYGSARALARLGERLPLDMALELVRRELAVKPEVWRSYRLLDLAGPFVLHEDGDAALRKILQRRSEVGLDHVFTVLGLALPPRPLRAALQCLYAEDPALRAVALEYLENALPAEIRTALWPFIAAEEATPSQRSARDVADVLLLSQPSASARLDAIAARRA